MIPFRTVLCSDELLSEKETTCKVRSVLEAGRLVIVGHTLWRIIGLWINFISYCIKLLSKTNYQTLSALKSRRKKIRKEEGMIQRKQVVDLLPEDVTRHALPYIMDGMERIWPPVSYLWPTRHCLVDIILPFLWDFVQMAFRVPFCGWSYGKV